MIPPSRLLPFAALQQEIQCRGVLSEEGIETAQPHNDHDQADRDDNQQQALVHDYSVG